MSETQTGSRWLVCSTPAHEKWHTVFQISGFIALWRTCHGCQKTIKKPLWGNAFANQAPDTATRCTLVDESGMHHPQPWSQKGFPCCWYAPWPFSSPSLSLTFFFFFLTSEGFGSRKSSATILHGFHIIAIYLLRNKCLKTVSLFMHQLCLFAVLLSLRCWSCPHSHMQGSCSSHPWQS